jgi:hypothetical protein
MKTKWQPINRVVKIIIAFVFLFSLVMPASIVFADEGTPPATPTETDPPVEEEVSPEDETVPETETPEGEEPAGEEVSPEDETADESATLDEPTNEDATVDVSMTEETVADEPVADESDPESEEQTEEEPVLAQVPEGTDIVVVDEEGEVVPLVTEEAAEAIATSDPMWCPDGVDPIANTDGCTDSYSSMSALLGALSGGSQPAQDGTIWIEASYDSSSAEGGASGISIDGNTYFTWADYSLTVQGGWDGTDAGGISGTSTFSGDRFRIINWRNDVTVRDITSDGAGGGASIHIEIETPGTNSYDVTLENVEVRNNSDSRGVLIDNDQSTGSVTVNNSEFTNNGTGINDDGLFIRALGDVTLSDVNASGNGDEGVRIFTEGEVTVEDITASNNMDQGLLIINLGSSNGDPVTLNGINNMSNNADDGLAIYSTGTITLNEVTANGNGTAWNDNGARLDNDAGNGDVIINGYYNSFSNNSGPGLYISTIGNIDLYFATITGNNTNSGSTNGAMFITPGPTSRSARVYCSTFGNNSGYGLDAWTFENSLTFVGQNNFSGNPSGDYRFNGTAVFEDPTYLCEEPVPGCTDPTAFNYDPNANIDDGSCEAVVLGCTDPTAFNYDPNANTDDGSCIPVGLGCTDPTAFNYDPDATTDDGSCEAVVKGCTDPAHENYDPSANTSIPCDEKESKTSVLIPATGGQFTPISCATPMVSMQMPNGDYVAFGNLCGNEAMLEKVAESGLPGELPDDGQYVSGLKVALAKDGSVVEPLPIGTTMTVAFKVPGGMEGETFAIMRWDGGDWVEESVSVENSYVKTTTVNTGTFVLVTK